MIQHFWRAAVGVVALMVIGSPSSSRGLDTRPQDRFVNAPPEGVSPELWHSLAAVAKYTCINVFLARQPVQPYADNLSGAFLDYPVVSGVVLDPDRPLRSKQLRYQVDSARQTLTVTFGNVSRTARNYDNLECVVQPNDLANLKGTAARSGLLKKLPDPQAGLVVSKIDAFEAAIDPIFTIEPERIGSVLVLHGGKIVAERYAPGSNADTLFHGWSMTKSLQAAMVGVLEQQGKLQLYESVNFPEWQNDDRNDIRIGDAMRMSSGLKCEIGSDYPASAYDDLGYPDYEQTWTDAFDAFSYIAHLPKQFPRATYGRYKDCDPAIVGRVLKKKVEASGEDYGQWLQTELLDKIGVGSMHIGMDPAGNMLGAADGVATSRDWARLALLWLRNGVAPSGERLLSTNMVAFTRMPVPVWLDKGREYGAGFWLKNSFMRDANLPSDTFMMGGGSGQSIFIIPSLDLVIVRLSHDDLAIQRSTGTVNLLRAVLNAAEMVKS